MTAKVIFDYQEVSEKKPSHLFYSILPLILFSSPVSEPHLLSSKLFVVMFFLHPLLSFIHSLSPHLHPSRNPSPKWPSVVLISSPFILLPKSGPQNPGSTRRTMTITMIIIIFSIHIIPIDFRSFIKSLWIPSEFNIESSSTSSSDVQTKSGGKKKKSWSFPFSTNQVKREEDDRRREREGERKEQRKRAESS